MQWRLQKFLNVNFMQNTPTISEITPTHFSSTMHFKWEHFGRWIPNVWCLFSRSRWSLFFLDIDWRIFTFFCNLIDINSRQICFTRSYFFHEIQVEIKFNKKNWKAIPSEFLKICVILFAFIKKCWKLEPKIVFEIMRFP